MVLLEADDALGIVVSVDDASVDVDVSVVGVNDSVVVVVKSAEADNWMVDEVDVVDDDDWVVVDIDDELEELHQFKN